MKALIVNADDYGISPGVTRGILEAHDRGILTSASFMVDTPSAADAARLAREAPRMSMGLHADLPAAIAADRSRCHDDLERQIDRFATLTGRAPTHLDSHHNVHRHAALATVFTEVAARHALPLREGSAARYFSKFYGQWSGRSHLEHIGVASLANMLESELGEGLTELSCHPGYPDLIPGITSSARSRCARCAIPGSRACSSASASSW